MDSDKPPTDALAELRSGLDELRGIVLELRAARTPQEKADLREELDDAEQDVEKLAKKYGLPASAIRESISQAKKAERREELRPIVLELLEELVGTDDDAEAEKAGKDGAGVKDEGEPEPERKPRAPRAPKPDAEAEDEPPVVPHWSDRSIGDLMRKGA